MPSYHFPAEAGQATDDSAAADTTTDTADAADAAASTD